MLTVSRFRIMMEMNVSRLNSLRVGLHHVTRTLYTIGFPMSAVLSGTLELQVLQVTNFRLNYLSDLETL